MQIFYILFLKISILYEANPEVKGYVCNGMKQMFPVWRFPNKLDLKNVIRPGLKFVRPDNKLFIILRKM